MNEERLSSLAILLMPKHKSIDKVVSEFFRREGRRPFPVATFTVYKYTINVHIHQYYLGRLTNKQQSYWIVSIFSCIDRFLKVPALEIMGNGISEALKIKNKNKSVRVCPQTPLEARAFNRPLFHYALMCVPKLKNHATPLYVTRSFSYIVFVVVILEYFVVF